MDFLFIHSETKEEKIISLTEQTIQNLLEDTLLDMVMTCDCEPVGETNVVECNCEDYLEDFYIQER